jgi:hypothetical protein
MALRKNRPLEISPLDASPAPFGTPLAHLATPVLGEQRKLSESPASFDSATLRTMLSSKNKLRELAVISEILQPPLALRRRNRAR